MPSKVLDEITYPFPNFNGCIGLRCSTNGVSLKGLILVEYHKEGRLTARSREVSKPYGSEIDFSNFSEILQALRQQRCQDTCQISERYNHDSIQF